MSGIYIHIPFCRRKCHYCNFFSMASLKYKDEFIQALIKEIDERKTYLTGKDIVSIYLGGGTPSLLSEGELNTIFDKLYSVFKISPSAEITLEANPDDISVSKIRQLKGTPVNRLSIGVQSFRDADLKYLNRTHTAKQAEESVRIAGDAGFENISIDLIYGIPGLEDPGWKKNLEIFLSLGLPHLSAYALTVEDKTALKYLINKGRVKPVDENLVVSQFKILTRQMREAGFIHYEISNFAREGYYSVHNSTYWTGGHYLGLGPSAHSFNGESRQWNPPNLTKYIREPGTHESVAEKEILTAEQRYNEYIMTSLRTVWGCDIEHIRLSFGDQRASDCLKKSMKFIKNGKIRKEGNKLFLTEEGKLFADGIAGELFCG